MCSSLTLGPVEPPTARAVFMQPYLFFLLPVMPQEAGTLLMHPQVTRGQAQMDVRAGCWGELFSTPSLRCQPLTHPAGATFLFP